MSIIEMKKIRLGVMDIPKDYFDFTFQQKKDLCEDLMDKLYLYIDERLDTEYNRIEFLRDVLVSSLESNEEEEQYEICQVISDCIKLLDEE
jgi:uncharacterized protein with NRDE domain